MTTQPTTVADELAAMRRIVATLEKLDPATQERIMAWLFDRNVTPAPTLTATPRRPVAEPTGTFGCLYFGTPGECCECGGQSTNGTRYCSHDCADNARQHAEKLDRAIAERRAREDLFAAEGAKLRALGHTDEEIDVLLVGIPT